MLSFWVRLKQRKFNKEEWDTNLNSRKYFCEDIIKSKMLVNKSASECEKLLGVKNRDVYYGVGFKLQKWNYFLYKGQWGKKSYSLMIWFEKNRIIKVKLVSKIKTQ